MKTLLGVFTDKGRVTDAINTLRDRGFNPKDISIVMRDSRQANEIKNDTGADVAGGAVSGATTGAILGGLAGLLAAFVIPGLGAFFIGGPIAASLGLTGAAASTVSGAATGVVAGGLLGALMGFGLNENEAKQYQEKIEQGAILIAVPVTMDNEQYCKEVLEDYGATDVKSFTQQSQGTTTRHTSRRYADMPSEESKSSDYEDINEEDIAQTYTSAGAKGGKTRIKNKDSDYEKSRDNDDSVIDTDEDDELI